MFLKIQIDSAQESAHAKSDTAARAWSTAVWVRVTESRRVPLGFTQNDAAGRIYKTFSKTCDHLFHNQNFEVSYPSRTRDLKKVFWIPLLCPWDLRCSEKLNYFLLLTNILNAPGETRNQVLKLKTILKKKMLSTTQSVGQRTALAGSSAGSLILISESGLRISYFGMLRRRQYKASPLKTAIRLNSPMTALVIETPSRDSRDRTCHIAKQNVVSFQLLSCYGYTFSLSMDKNQGIEWQARQQRSGAM